MNISDLLQSSINHLFHSSDQPNSARPSQLLDASSLRAFLNDRVSLSSAGQQLLASDTPAPLYSVIPADQRPSAQQSADVILGFIGLRMQSLQSDGASQEEMEAALQQALEGFQKGLQEALEIIEGLGMLTGDLQSGIAQTEQLVLEGLEQLRGQYLTSGSAVTAPAEEAAGGVRSVVAGYSSQSSVESRVASAVASSGDTGGVRAAAASYAASYRRDESVDLQVQTRDGDIINLSFEANVSADASRTFALGSGPGGSFAGVASQSSYSSSLSFSLTVQGELDAGEREALNALLEDVAALSDEFFNGDFDQAFAMALEFEMDSSEFSALSLDLASATRASVTESVAATGSFGPNQSESAVQSPSLPSMLERLLAMMERADHFAEPRDLLTQLLANQMAQQNLSAQQSLLDSLSPALESLFDGIA